MDKRTLLAFVFIGVILLLTPRYQEWIIGSPSGNQSPHSENSEPIGANSSPKVLDSSVSTPSSPALLDSADLARPVPEKEVVLENDLFISRWSSKGGVLKSWVLKDFKDGSSGLPVELVRQGGSGCVLFLGGEDLSALDFVPSSDSLVVHGDQTSVLVWTARWKSYLLEKRVVISGRRYDFGVEVVGGGDQKCRLDWKGGLAHSESKLVDESSVTMIITYMGGVIEGWDFDHAKSPKSRPSGEGGWIGLRNKYFLVAFVPERNSEYGMVLDGKDSLGSKVLNFGLISESQRGLWRGSIFGGPISYSVLGGYFNGELRQAISWGWEWSRGLMEPIGVGILQVFLTIHQLVPNYGFVIILFSFLVKIVLYPLTHKSYEATSRMQEIQPQITALREKYQNDQQRLNQEMMKLYKEQGINPLGGCLPVLLQMPLLFALFNVFQNAIELRQASFMGWITDLSQPEALDFFGYPLRILPIFMALTMFLQQKSTIKDPNQKIMVYLMPVMMIFFFWTVSSGLVLYWTMFNLLSWLQQVGIERIHNRVGA